MTLPLICESVPRADKTLWQCEHCLGDVWLSDHARKMIGKADILCIPCGAKLHGELRSVVAVMVPEAFRVMVSRNLRAMVERN